MTYPATVLKVMIASPSDVRAERDVIREAIHEWNAIHSFERGLVLLPVGWESNASPEMGDRAQGIISKQILSECDLLIAVFWTRFGSPTGKAASGTEEEVREHLAAGKPALLYFSDAPLPPRSIDNAQYDAVKNFRQECRRNGLVEEYGSLSEFTGKLRRQLAQTVNRKFSAVAGTGGFLRIGDPIDGGSSEPTVPAITNDAQELLSAAIGGQHGTIVRSLTIGGASVSANHREFVEAGNARSDARWQSALNELIRLGLVEDRNRNGQVFFVTNEGFETGDRL